MPTTKIIVRMAMLIITVITIYIDGEENSEDFVDANRNNDENADGDFEETDFDNGDGSDNSQGDETKLVTMMMPINTAKTTI